MSVQSVIITMVAAILGSGIINVLLTHFLLGRRLEEEQKKEYERMFAKKIFKALIKTRDLEQRCKSIEILEIDEKLNNGRFDAFTDHGVYPEIFNDKETFSGFFHDVGKVRKEHERYLSYTEAAYLLYIEKYCMEMMVIVAEDEIPWPYAGAIFGVDIQAWQREFEDVLVHSLNNYRHKVFSQNKMGWELAKIQITDRLWKKSLLLDYKKKRDKE